jgi:hypothetical protein
VGVMSRHPRHSRLSRRGRGASAAGRGCGTSAAQSLIRMPDVIDIAARRIRQKLIAARVEAARLSCPGARSQPMVDAHHQPNNLNISPINASISAIMK